MGNIFKALALVAGVALSSQVGMASDMPDGAKIFSKKCKMCHAINKKKVGPAVASMNMDTNMLIETVTNGRKRMPKFGHKLSADEIQAVVAFIQSNHAE
ncbi:c-type cytochrome [Ghiorsea bivora]|uniref:c-type cytochrome n=1 Tax=Ghiorsea bivora TaxID=1485545 RepID=UPI00056E9B2C|nr:cytochrome c [Ghiorsea bivora]